MTSSTPSLAGLWAKHYVQALQGEDEQVAQSAPNRARTASDLMSALRFTSSQAWSKTEALLRTEIQRHRMNEALIDPWKIADDSRQLFQKAAEGYVEGLSPERFSVAIAPACGKIRHSYTASDPRVLGFMSMQFHYTGQLLIEDVPASEKETIRRFLKVMDDHLYMPLHRSYEAAAQHDYNAPELMAVRQLLPLTTQMAELICTTVAQRHPNYTCLNGRLDNPIVRISSVRDAEMFQVYLCLCVLEGSIASVQQELFPLCVLLYPPLNVRWDLVRDLLRLIDQSIQMHLAPSSAAIFKRYLGALQDMFSEDVFPEDDPIWNVHPDTVRYMDEARSLLQEILKNQAS